MALHESSWKAIRDKQHKEIKKKMSGRDYIRTVLCKSCIYIYILDFVHGLNRVHQWPRWLNVSLNGTDQCNMYTEQHWIQKIFGRSLQIPSFQSHHSHRLIAVVYLTFFYHWNPVTGNIWNVLNQKSPSMLLRLINFTNFQQRSANSFVRFFRCSGWFHYIHKYTLSQWG